MFDKKAGKAKDALLHANNLKKDYCGYLLISLHPHDKQDHLKVRNFIGPISSHHNKEPVHLSPAEKTLFPVDQLFVYNLM